MWIVYDRNSLRTISSYETAAEARHVIIVHNGNADDSDLWEMESR